MELEGIWYGERRLGQFLFAWLAAWPRGSVDPYAGLCYTAPAAFKIQR
jgi:hypothetical protein